MYKKGYLKGSDIVNVETVWNKFLELIRQKVSPISYNLWFKNLRLIKLFNNKATILVSQDDQSNEQFINSLVNNYYDTIKELIDKITEDSYDIEFTSQIPVENSKKIIVENEINNNVSNDDTDITTYKYYNNFESKYTFETFVVGDSNRLAYGTALAVAKKPGKLYNPFFIHGKSGLGKTHLMHAIGNYIVNNSDLKVLYISAERFINDYKAMLNYKNKNGNNISYLDAFRNKYRNVDVLMIDDIQFLNNAPKSQIEFTNTFNTLYDNEKQIIIASDTSVKDLNNLADRLKTRFMGGLTESIMPPDIELKKEIIINKIKLNDYSIDVNDEIIDYIANNCGTDVRNLEGTIIRLVAYTATFNISKITLDIAKEALQEFTTNTTMYRVTNVPKIIEIVAKYYNLDSSMLKGKMRRKDVVNARSVAMYLSRIKTYETVERIGLEFGAKNHSTVIYSSNKIADEMKINSILENDIKVLSEKICE